MLTDEEYLKLYDKRENGEKLTSADQDRMWVFEMMKLKEHKFSLLDHVYGWFYRKFRYIHIDFKYHLWTKWYQRFMYGCDYRELWSLDNTIAKWVLPRIKRFKKIKGGYPACLEDEKEWDDILDKIIFSMEMIASGDDTIHVKYPPGYKHDTISVPIKGTNTSRLIWIDPRKPDYSDYDQVQKRIEEGLELFGKYFRALWY